MPGFSIRIFVPQGTPDGLRIVEKSNWTGRGVICPRPQFRDVKCRPEFGKTGVYILTGPSESSDLPTVYVGEGDPARPRLESHFANKDFWTSLILFTSKDDNLNKAHVQYLESRLYNLAADAKRCELENGNVPQLPSLSEADAADMEGYLAEMLLIFPVLGLSIFEKPSVQVSHHELLHFNSRGVVATGYESPDGFVVLAGSQVSQDTVASMQPYLQSLRDSLMRNGTIVANGTANVFSQDYTFNSPSTAAGVIGGRSYNGREWWRDAQGKTLKEIQTTAAMQ